MHKFFTPKELINGDVAKIIGDDVKHIYKVLRISEGEKVTLNNCEGIEYLGKVISVSKQEVLIEILEKLEDNNESDIKIYLFQGLPKSQKMDLIVQKGTELGITEFIPTITHRVDVKLKGEFKKLDRLNRIALEAAKQSKRGKIPKLRGILSFKDALEDMKNNDLNIAPYENERTKSIKQAIKGVNINTMGIFVGPEGGFEESEIEAIEEISGKSVSLGPRILRTETASLVASSIVLYELSDLGGDE